METEASESTISGVLRILPESDYVPVAYKLSKIMDEKWKYPINNKLMLATIHCL